MDYSHRPASRATRVWGDGEKIKLAEHKLKYSQQQLENRTQKWQGSIGKGIQREELWKFSKLVLNNCMGAK